MVLDFEKNIVEIEAKIEGLKLLAKDEDVDIAHEVNRLQQKLEKQVKQSYANLTPWQKSQVPAIRTVRTAWTTFMPSLKISRPCAATARLPTTRP